MGTKKKQPTHVVNNVNDVEEKSNKYRADGTREGTIPRSGSGRQYGYL